MIIGLTGQSGSGKSSLSPFFLRLGFVVIDCDRVYREMTDKSTALTEEIAAHFGNQVLSADGGLCRNALASLVFADADCLKALNRITHPAIVLELENRLSELPPEQTAVLDAPTLFESGADRLCDRTIAVLSDPQLRLKRILERDALQPQQAKLRLEAQPADDFYIHRADAVVWNNGELSQFFKKIEAVLRQFGVMP